MLWRYRFQFSFAVQATYPQTPAPNIIEVKAKSLMPIATFRSIIQNQQYLVKLHSRRWLQNERNRRIDFGIVLYNYQQMLQSISNLFSTPIIPRSYQSKPSLRSHLARVSVKRYGKQQNQIDRETADIIDSLTKPIQTWIIQKQPHLKSMALNTVINKHIMESKLSCLGLNNQQKKVTVHNLFILIIQYKVLNERIKQMGTEQVEGYLNGLCKIFLEEEKGPLDELTCLLHFVISNSKLFICENLKDSMNTCLFKPIEISSQKAQNFIKVYSQIQQKNQGQFIDIVVNIIPMMTELCKVIVKTQKSQKRICLLKDIKWLGSIGLELLDIITKDVESVFQRQEVPNQQIGNPALRKRLYDKGTQLIQIEGISTKKVLFSYAYKQLYYFQYCLRLHMYMTELSALDEEKSIQQQTHNLNLVKNLLKLCCKYEFNIPDTNIQFLANILQESLFDSNKKNQLYLPNLKDPNLQIFIEDLKSSPSLQANSCYNEDEEQQFEFYFEKDDSIVSYILEMLYSLKLEYLQLLKIILIKTGKGYIEILQFYLMKNGFLHFMVEDLQSIQTTDKKILEDYFQILGLLLHKNNTAYFIMNDILQKEFSDSLQKSNLVEYIRKNFIHARKFLLLMLSDTIYINSKQQFNKYFLPFPLQSLLYNYFKNSNVVKHDVWTSYILDVIVRELQSKRQKDKLKKAYYQQQISEWVMLAILLQAELMTYKNGSDVDLWQFTMAYLTNMLQEAIKWNPNDETSVMKKLLKSYEDWQTYYTERILQTEAGEDIIQSRFGPTVNFLYLRKWNRKICKSIKIFIETVSTTKMEELKDFKLT